MPLYPPYPAATTSTAGVIQLDGTAAHILGDGTEAAGANALSADSGHTHPAPSITPADHGLLAWSYDIDATGQGFALIAGTVYLVKIPIRAAITATYLWFGVTGAGSGSSSGSYVGLYSSAGSLLTGSSDLGSSITAVNHQVTLTTPQSLSAGTFVWAAIVTNQASTQPSLRSLYSYGGGITPNLNLTAATYRIATNGTSQTALPSPSITPSSNSQAAGNPLWFGIS